MNLNEATQLLRKNGYIVESVFDNPEYKEWYGIFHDKLLDAFVSLEIDDKFQQFLEDHKNEIQRGFLMGEPPKAYSRSILDNYSNELQESTKSAKNHNLMNEDVEVSTADWYHSNARKELEDYMISKVVPAVCKELGNLPVEKFWDCFADDFYMDYMLPLGIGMLNEWINKAVHDMYREYIRRDGLSPREFRAQNKN